MWKRAVRGQHTSYPKILAKWPLETLFLNVMSLVIMRLLFVKTERYVIVSIEMGTEYLGPTLMTRRITWIAVRPVFTFIKLIDNVIDCELYPWTVCSRQFDEVNQKLGKYKLNSINFMRCKSNGNYEPFQMITNYTYCINTTSGEMLMKPVQKSNQDKLPCSK